VTLADRAWLSDTPSLRKPDFDRLRWWRWHDAGHDIAYAVRTSGGNPHELASASRRCEDTVDDPRRLLHGADRRALVNDSTRGDTWRKRPQTIGVQRLHTLSPAEEVPFRCRKPIEGPLDAVEDRPEKPRAEIDRQRPT
jgi:hypothetical protein